MEYLYRMGLFPLKANFRKIYKTVEIFMQSFVQQVLHVCCIRIINNSKLAIKHEVQQ